MWISEVFCSIQGEGRYLGEPSGFIRTSGCNLRCRFCDTPYTSWNPEGTEWSLEALVQEMAHYDCRHVVITGGEPMLVPELVPLTEALHRQGHVITIETAGTVDREVTADLLSISPKLSNSLPDHGPWRERHQSRRDRPDVVAELTRRYDYQLKFVVDEPGDLDEIDAYVQRFPHVRPDQIYLMPQGTDLDTISPKMDWLKIAADQRGWRTTPRLHIELFGNTRGT